MLVMMALVVMGTGFECGAFENVRPSLQLTETGSVVDLACRMDYMVQANQVYYYVN